MEMLTTLGVTRTVEDIYVPRSIDELILQFPVLRAKYRNIAAVSRGQNWGYGCSAPSCSGGLVVNLSQCHLIKNFDSYHGLVTLEPGVTFGQLADFLKNNGDEWISPVHGGGPDCSVVGNALERGYGITPYTDHFGAVMGLKALLPNGELFEGTLTKMGLPNLDRIFKYGVGPYYDGLFTQSGLGIVTEITFRLARRPEFVEMFYYNIQNEDDLEYVIDAVKKSKQELGSAIGGINLINRERCLSMVIDYPLDLIRTREPLSEKMLHQEAKRFLLTPWLVIGMFYGRKSVVQAARKIVSENFKNIKKRSLYYNSRNRVVFHWLSQIFSAVGLSSFSTGIRKLEQAYQVLNGVPNNVALQMAYWKHENKSMVSQPHLNPNRDGCGLIWYAPLVEMNPKSIREYVLFINDASEKFHFNSLITLTTIDDLCFDSTIPILFNQQDPLDVKRAQEFYQFLLVEGKKRGFFPYRLNIESQLEFDFQMKTFGLDAVNSSRYGSMGSGGSPTEHS